jgi:hypothetical protein
MDAYICGTGHEYMTMPMMDMARWNNLVALGVIDPDLHSSLEEWLIVDEFKVL